jgi:hypothetical protein
MKVYINIPERAVAGGVEALYQLADAINSIGKESIVVFDNNIPDPIPDKYSHYNVKYSTEIEDVPENWIIFAEVYTDKVYSLKNIKKAIWWLSVDNNQGKFQDFSNLNIHHFYQSYYALQYLLQNQAQYYLPLFDYISPKYIDAKYDISKKQNIVCYNPVKGKYITDQIINANPDITFIPLAYMTEDQVIETLKQSKVYIDFGNHPGKDRIPREAAILGNCVITGFKGASMFYNDTPLDNNFKFEDISEVGYVIRECFSNFEDNLKKFSLYRSIIQNQKEEFINQVKQIFLNI